MLSATIISATASAGPLSHRARRQMNRRVFDMCENYEVRSIVSRKSDKYGFKLMFSDDAKIFCDLYNTNRFTAEISPEEYADLVLNRCENVDVILTNAKKKSLEQVGDKWIYTIGLDKFISYNDKLGVLFPFNEAQKQYFNLEVAFEFDADDMSNCRISSIKCLNSNSFPVFKNYWIVQQNTTTKEAVMDRDVFSDGKKLEFNSFRQAYSEHGDFEYWDDNVRLTVEDRGSNEEYKYVQFKYQPCHFRIKLRNQFALGSAYKVIANSAFEPDSKSSAYEVGVDLGYSMSLSRKLMLEIYTGLSMSMSKLDLSYGQPINYSYETTDRNGDVYTRSYAINSVSQSVKFKDLMVPLYLNLNYKINKNHYLTLDFGVKAYFNTNATADSFHMAGQVSAAHKYPGHDLNQIGGLGAFDADYNEFLSAVAFERKSVDLSAAVNLGYNLNLWSRKLFLDFKIGYEFGFGNSYESDENAFFDPSKQVYPMVYLANEERDVVFRPMADCVSFKREALWLNLGFIYKF